jgi:hypothetical protein
LASKKNISWFEAHQDGMNDGTYAASLASPVGRRGRAELADSGSTSRAELDRRRRLRPRLVSRYPANAGKRRGDESEFETTKCANKKWAARIEIT